MEYLDPQSPQPKRKRRKTTHGASAGSRDSTLTQINFIRRRQPEQDEADLDYINTEHEGIVPAGIDGSIAAESATTKREKRASQQSTSKAPRRSSSGETRPATSRAQRVPEKPAYELMPPPRTPRKILKREIASSQSPEGSVVSTQSPSPKNRRSPLKEMSTNTRLNREDGTRALEMQIQRKPSLAVEDTYSPSQSRISTQAATETQGQGLSKLVKTEIEDSDMESEESSGETSPSRRATQFSRVEAALPPPGTTAPSVQEDYREAVETTHPLGISTLPEHTLIHVALESHSSNDAEPTLPQPPQPSSQSDVQEPNGQPSSDISSAETPVLPPPTLTRSESAQASAQLLGEMVHYTQHRPPNPMIMETESQFENAFRHVWASDFPGHPSSEHDKHNAMLVPTSQASTVDVTQASPKPVRSSATGVESSSPSRVVGDTEEDNVNGKEVVLVPSSPIIDHYTLPNERNEDKEKLTDSQLLPDSIMNFQLPPMSSDSLEAEEECY